MCLIALNWRPNAPSPLIIAANRDEFYARPTQALHCWGDHTIVAGRDLQAGGTWLGVSTSGRAAALTNYRDISQNRPDAQSRGDITTAFLGGTVTAKQYLGELASRAHIYNPFNLLVFDGTSLMGFESRHRRAFIVPEGVTAVSNADFNTPWPKLSRLREGFAGVMGQYAVDGERSVEPHGINALFALLSERRIAADTELPRTGIALDRERALSAEFIHTPHYGTRASTVLIVNRNHASMVERSFDVNGFAGEVHQRIEWKVQP